MALTVMLVVAVVAGALVTAASFLDGRAYPGEFLTLFRIQLVGAAVLLGVLAAIGGRHRIAVAAAVLALVHVVALIPALTADGRPDPTTPRLRLLVANVWLESNDYARLAELVERERPDVIGLTELTPEWADGIAPHLEDYPYRVVEPQPGAYGVGLYSRRQLQTPAIVRPAGDGPPVAHAVVPAGDTLVPLFVVHAPAPIGIGSARRHRAFMSSLGDLAAAAGENVLVCGDLNSTPWSDSFRTLADRGDLRRADPWRPFQTTYPVWNRLLRTPLDHCLAAEGLAVEVRRGPETGSDHLPLLIAVAPS